jgi:hypothetical protein
MGIMTYFKAIRVAAQRVYVPAMELEKRKTENRPKPLQGKERSDACC